jgi:hypothetical protein
MLHALHRSVGLCLHRILNLTSQIIWTEIITDIQDLFINALNLRHMLVGSESIVEKIVNPNKEII